MSSLSVAVLVGRLTRDAELKYTNSGQAVCHFSVATNTRRKKGDQWVEEPSYWDLDYWGKPGESISKYLTKGKLVAIEGTMRQDRWEQEGQTRSKVVITVNTVQFIGTGRGQEGSASDNDSSESAPSETSPKKMGSNSQSGSFPSGSSGDDFADDIPF